VERGSSLEQNEEIQIWAKTTELSVYPSVSKLNLHLFKNECWKLLYSMLLKYVRFRQKRFVGKCFRLNSSKICCDSLGGEKYQDLVGMVKS